MAGMKSQITVLLGAVFVVVNMAFPDLLTKDVEAAITTILVTAYALFMAMKVQRKDGGK